ISSSGHLIIGAAVLDFNEPGIIFDVFLHLGTLLAILVVFRQEIKGMLFAPFFYLSGSRTTEIQHNLRWDLYVILSVLPAVAVGLFANDAVEEVFTNLPLVFAMLFITGIMMVISGHLPTGKVTLKGKHAFLIGCAQAMAILPGISRSGATIFTGMALGINREIAARFAFIMSIPAILGAIVLHLPDLIRTPPSTGSIANIAAGTLASAVAGYFAIVLLLGVVRKNRLEWFGYYCLLLSICGSTYLLLA
ncbi:MAG: undecaprenyl-diphosphate phosphatase, partial [Desulfopila sp.]|nr:undecaprenyl-diphosphate phosphatase [Desulfopila sp.]